VGRTEGNISERDPIAHPRKGALGDRAVGSIPIRMKAVEAQLVMGHHPDEETGADPDGQAYGIDKAIEFVFAEPTGGGSEIVGEH